MKGIRSDEYISVAIFQYKMVDDRACIQQPGTGGEKEKIESYTNDLTNDEQANAVVVRSNARMFFELLKFFTERWYLFVRSLPSKMEAEDEEVFVLNV